MDILVREHRQRTNHLALTLALTLPLTLIVFIAGCATSPSQPAEDVDLASQEQKIECNVTVNGQRSTVYISKTECANVQQDDRAAIDASAANAPTSKTLILCKKTEQGIETVSNMTPIDCQSSGGAPYGQIADASGTSTQDEPDGCDGSPRIVFSVDDAKRIYCEQGINEGTMRFENTVFEPATSVNDILHVLHFRLIDPEYYYPHQNIAVGEQLKQTFNSLGSQEFSEDGVVKTGFAKVFNISRFTLDGDHCFGFTKHTRQSLSTGYFCRADNDDYETAEIRERLAQLKFK